MPFRASRLTRAFIGSVAPAIAGALFMACSAGPTDSVSETAQAVKGTGLFHSNVTKESWRRHVGQNHGRWDDERRCHPKALALCPLFDSDFLGVDLGPACAKVTTPDCLDRAASWDNAIVFDFAVALSSDCRFGQWAPPLLEEKDVVNYLNDLLAFTLQLFGCPIEGTDSKLTFGLIPSALQGHKVTTADLEALSDAYVAAVEQALADNGSPALTADQAKALEAKLDRLAHRVPGKVHSRKFTFSTCAAGEAAADGRPDDGRDLDCR